MIKNIGSLQIQKNGTGPLLTLNKFCKSEMNEGLYNVGIKNNARSASRWALAPGYKINIPLYKPSADCPKNLDIQHPKETISKLSDFALINLEGLPDLEKSYDYLEEATFDDLEKLIGIEIGKMVKEKLPDCLFWNYGDQVLLPGKIDINQFKDSPSTCQPLKNMFELAEIEDIEEAITGAQGRTNGLRNLLNRVATKITKHISSVWKDYKSIKISLQENGSFIDAGVEDTLNVYNFSKRSDGFKRFITFLLMVSAKERINDFSNTLLLIDEPDIGLHPSGTRHLRDELLKIAENNYVVFSTHSIFMIDRDNIGRHLIVEKIRKQHQLKK